jgi:ADP-heptose:LPS heptosyltransferase
MAAILGHLWLRAPNHLGDGVMALPALSALVAAADRATIGAPRWGRELYGGLDAEIVECAAVPRDADIAILFAPSFRAAWQAKRVPRRIGLATDARWWLLSEAVQPLAQHRRDDYASLASRLGVSVPPAPRFGASATADGSPHVGLNPVSASGLTVDWPHFGALATRLVDQGVPVVVYAGLGDSERVRAAVPSSTGAAYAPEHDLNALAAALGHCRLFVSNDSGLGHFAAACHTPVLSLFGSTAAAQTGPIGAITLEADGPECRPCYRKHCPYAKPEVPCLAQLELDVVERTVLARWGVSP